MTGKCTRGHGSVYSHAYITSPFYSGSTILSMALNMHPSVSTIGEFYLCYPLDTVETPLGYQCSCGIALKDCEYWQTVHRRIQQITGTTVDFFNFPLRPRFARSSMVNGAYLPLRENPLVDRTNRWLAPLLPLRKKKLHDFRVRHNVYFPAVFEATESTCFVDSSKSLAYLRLLPELQADNADTVAIKVLRLTRSIQGTVCSEKRRKENFNWQDLRRCADRWVKAQRLTERVLSDFCPDSVLQVDYDQFCASPEQELQRIFRFLKLPDVAIDLDLRARPHHVVGNTARFLRNFTGIERDERWQQILSARELKFLELF
jgi:Sulfotransferase family